MLGQETKCNFFHPSHHWHDKRVIIQKHATGTLKVPIVNSDHITSEVSLFAPMHDHYIDMLIARKSLALRPFFKLSAYDEANGKCKQRMMKQKRAPPGGVSKFSRP